MNKLLIIADDLTGALDTGVCFASMGISTRVRLTDNIAARESSTVEVALVESRHMRQAEAYKAVYDLILGSNETERRYIYKKTDSALRGNIGAELTASLDATGAKTIHFIPSFPKMNRIARDGVLYINGTTPVSESVFAQDPFNPVRHSSILEIIAEQSDRNAYIATANEEKYPEGIAVYNAETDEQIVSIGQHLVKEIGATLFAGCAGFANALSLIISFETANEPMLPPGGKLAVFCGSVNPISLEQCDAAERAGYPRFHLQQEGTFIDREQIANQLIAASRQNEIVVLDTGADDLSATEDDVLAQSAVVADHFSKVISDYFTNSPDVTMFIIGGDTLLAFARRLGIDAIFPVNEILPGVVLSRYTYSGKLHYLITKSGGFGSRNLIAEIAALLVCEGC